MLDLSFEGQVMNLIRPSVIPLRFGELYWNEVEVENFGLDVSRVGESESLEVLAAVVAFRSYLIKASENVLLVVSIDPWLR